MSKMFLLMLYAFLLVLSVSSHGAKLVTPDSIWLKNKIDRLASLNVIQIPINTWPLALEPLLAQLADVKIAQQPEYVQAMVASVRRELTQNNVFQGNIGKTNHAKNNQSKAQQKMATSLTLSAGTQPVLLTQFGELPREQNAVILDIRFQQPSVLGVPIFGQLKPTLATDVDDNHLRYDGSYIGAQWGNWLLTLGAQDRWWGMGQHHSLILSNNARPVNALSIQRNSNDAFAAPFLSWMGPWTFNSFIGLLDDQRQIDDAKLMGMSLAFSPHNNVDIGLRRTAQWGGEGRPENARSFFNLLIGRDNCELDAAQRCTDRSQEPGNQLAAIDVTFNTIFGLPISSHIQMVGEDEAGYLPAKNTFMGGATYFGHLHGQPLSVGLEFIDTQLITTSGQKNNVLYEHVIYTTGYRYEGRSIGSSLDNDSLAAHLDVMFETPSMGDYRFSLSRIELNRDQARGSSSNHTITDGAVVFNELGLHWQKEIGDGFLNQSLSGQKISAQAFFRDEKLATKFHDFEKYSLQLQYQFRF